MKKEVFDYFHDLDQARIRRNNNGHIVLDENSSERMARIDNGIDIYRIGNHYYYVKSIYKPNYILPTMASSKLFNNSGILTPPVYSSEIMYDYGTYLHETTEDVGSIIQFKECVLASEAFKHTGIGWIIDSLPQYTGENKWNFLQREDVRSACLEIMTPECYDEFVNMFLIDELRTEEDRHNANFFLYKTSDSNKYNGVIPIDHDNSNIILSDIRDRDDFYNNYLKSYYSSYTPSMQIDNENYRTRHLLLRHLLQSGNLSDNNVRALKEALEFDYPQEIKNAGKKCHMSQSQINEMYTPISLLWEYNRENIGRDLGL